MKHIVTLWFMVMVASQPAISSNFPLLTKSFSYSTNVLLQKIINKMFTLLKLNKNFKENIKIMQYLDMFMHNNGKSVNNWNFYDETKNLIKSVDNSSENVLFKLNDLVDEILNEEIFVQSIPTCNNTNEVKKIGKIKTNEVALHDTKRLRTNEFLNVSNANEYFEFYKGNKSSLQTRRISMGMRAYISDYPFVVSIHVLEKFVCTGSILDRYIVLTSASCLSMHESTRHAKKPWIYIRYASNYAFKQGIVQPIKSFYIHPNFEGNTLKNNIAILKPRKAFDFSNPNIKKIHYETNEIILRESVINILGWGARDKSSVFHPNTGKLSYAELLTYDTEECTAIYSNNYVTDTNFCAGYITKGTGACNGDIGGPGIYEGLLIGIISFGAPICGTADSPTVLTRILHYTKWIQHLRDITNDEETETTAFYDVNIDKTDTTKSLFNIDNINLKSKTELDKYREIKHILKDILKELALTHGGISIDDLFER